MTRENRLMVTERFQERQKSRINKKACRGTTIMVNENTLTCTGNLFDYIDNLQIRYYIVNMNILVLRFKIVLQNGLPKSACYKIIPSPKPFQVYHKRTRTGWQGGKDLASSAYFTFEFCQALLRSWQSRDPCDGDLVTPDNTPMPMEASQGENSLASLAPAEEDGPIEIVINSDSDSDTPVTPMPEEASPGDDSLASPAPAEEDVITVLDSDSDLKPLRAQQELSELLQSAKAHLS